MWQNEQFKDWLFRYQYIYRFRNTEKNKSRFLNAFLLDLLKMRKDIQIMEYPISSKQTIKNVYIGDVSKAEKIICTYYDTPLSHFGTYEIFNQSKQRKKTLCFIAFSSFILILIGIIGVFLFLSISTQENNLFSIKNIIIVFLLLTYFSFLGKVSKGQLNYYTLIRNTSSVLFLMSLINKEKSHYVAFAFIDRATLGEDGFYFLEDKANDTAHLILLDSIGSPAAIEKIEKISDHSKHPISYIVSAQKNEEGLFLRKKDLKQKQINYENFAEVEQLLNSI